MLERSPFTFSFPYSHLFEPVIRCPSCDRWQFFHEAHDCESIPIYNDSYVRTKKDGSRFISRSMPIIENEIWEWASDEYG